MERERSLAYLQAGDTAWYKGKDGTTYEARVEAVGRARLGVMPLWVHILWTDVDAGMLVFHPERDLLTHDPRPKPAPEPEPTPEPAPEPTPEPAPEPEPRKSRRKA